MSEKGPFDAAIKILSEHRGHAPMDNSSAGIDEWNDCIDVIKVLEAAGKLKRESALRVLEQFWTLNPGCLTEEKYKVFCEIRALLEALPDKEGK